MGCPFCSLQTRWIFFTWLCGIISLVSIVILLIPFFEFFQTEEVVNTEVIKPEPAIPAEPDWAHEERVKQGLTLDQDQVTMYENKIHTKWQIDKVIEGVDSDGNPVKKSINPSGTEAYYDLYEYDSSGAKVKIILPEEGDPRYDEDFTATQLDRAPQHRPVLHFGPTTAPETAQSPTKLGHQQWVDKAMPWWIGGSIGTVAGICGAWFGGIRYKKARESARQKNPEGK